MRRCALRTVGAEAFKIQQLADIRVAMDTACNVIFIVFKPITIAMTNGMPFMNYHLWNVAGVTVQFRVSHIDMWPSERF